MKKDKSAQSAFFNLRLLLGLSLGLCGLALSILAAGLESNDKPHASQRHAQAAAGSQRPDVVPMIGPVNQAVDLRALPYRAPEFENEEFRLSRHPFPLSGLQIKSIPDPFRPVVERDEFVSMPAPIQTFAGMNSVQSGCGCLPPDTDGDVGPNHYVQSVNSSIKIFDKSGNALNGTNGTTYNSFFLPLGPTTPCGASQNDGDGIVFYDHMADRWVVSDFAFPAFPGVDAQTQAIAHGVKVMTPDVERRDKEVEELTGP